MSYAICLKCGARKVAYTDTCPSCRFQPTSHEEMARSLILSSDFHLESLGLPKSDEELLRLSTAIATGPQPDVLDSREVQAVESFLWKAKQFQSRWTLPRVVVLGVLPVLALLAFVVYLFSSIL